MISSGCCVSRRLQLVHQRVIVGIADHRRVHHVIEVLMPPQFRAQLLDALLRLRFAHLAHGQDYRVRGSSG